MVLLLIRNFNTFRFLTFIDMVPYGISAQLGFENTAPPQFSSHSNKTQFMILIMMLVMGNIDLYFLAICKILKSNDIL